jgi:hypothetical protein
MAEVEAANYQERYKRNMDKTLELINNKINNNEITDKTEICNTGLILYINYYDVKNMLDDIYNTCINLQQPECQIIWAIYSQKYLDKIKLIDFHNVVKPTWQEPFTGLNKNPTNNYIYLMIIFFFLVGVIIIYYNKKYIKFIKKFCNIFYPKITKM